MCLERIDRTIKLPHGSVLGIKTTYENFQGHPTGLIYGLGFTRRRDLFGNSLRARGESRAAYAPGVLYPSHTNVLLTESTLERYDAGFHFYPDPTHELAISLLKASSASSARWVDDGTRVWEVEGHDVFVAGYEVGQLVFVARSLTWIRRLEWTMLPPAQQRPSSTR